MDSMGSLDELAAIESSTVGWYCGAAEPVVTTLHRSTNRTLVRVRTVVA